MREGGVEAVKMGSHARYWMFSCEHRASTCLPTSAIWWCYGNVRPRTQATEKWRMNCIRLYRIRGYGRRTVSEDRLVLDRIAIKSW